MLIALDIATVTGFAFGGPGDGAPKTGIWRLPGTDELNLDRSLVSLRDGVAGLCKLAHAQFVQIEAPMTPQGRSATTAIALISLAAVAREAAHRSGAIVLRPVQVQTVRKHFVGHGRPADKKRAIMERCRLLGWVVEDHNSADAAAVWSYGMAITYPKWAPRSTPLFGRAA